MLSAIRKDKPGLRVVLALALLTLGAMLSGCATAPALFASVGSIAKTAGGILTGVGSALTGDLTGTVTTPLSLVMPESAKAVPAEPTPEPAAK